MVTYRVGAAGATVFNEDGQVVTRLRPGAVVVEGVVDLVGSLAHQYREQKRLKGYPDKKLRPTEDKAT